MMPDVATLISVPDAPSGIEKIAGALARAQAKMTGAAKTRVNPHFNSKYADLAAHLDACRGPLSAEGIAIVQDPESTPTGVALVTRLVHSSGQELRSGRLEVRLAQPTAQQLGSALTYLRRYQLAAMVGIAADDDDGNEASLPAPPEVAPARSQTEKVKAAVKDKLRPGVTSALLPVALTDRPTTKEPAVIDVAPGETETQAVARATPSANEHHAAIRAAIAAAGVTDPKRVASIVSGATGRTKSSQLDADDVGRVQAALAFMKAASEI